MELRVPKGTRDFSPEEKIVREKIVSTLKEVFELYGFSPFETPMFELFDVLSSKYTGGAEILKETFKLKDQGGRDLGLRYDLTVPLARFMAMNPKMKMPFKRYHVGEVFRDGPVSVARYRQFTQCDVDVIGAKSLYADGELLALMCRAFVALDLKAQIRMNNRKLLREMMEYCGVERGSQDGAVLIIDKMDKVGFEGVSKELKDAGMGKESIEKIGDLITLKGSNEKKLERLKEMIGETEGIKEVEEVLTNTKSLDVDVLFDPSLARGLSYYTGTIMEANLTEGKVKSSVCGGGRYDGMIGSLMGKGDVAAIGVSFGLDRIYDAIIERDGLKEKTVTRLLIAPIGQYPKAAEIAEKMRSSGIKTEIDLMERSPSKNLAYADSQKIRFIAFIGEEEAKTSIVKLKDMESGKDEMLAVDDAIERIKKTN